MVLDIVLYTNCNIFFNTYSKGYWTVYRNQCIHEVPPPPPPPPPLEKAVIGLLRCPWSDSRGVFSLVPVVPVPNSADFVAMAEASVLNFRRRLTAAWKERFGSESFTRKGSPQFKRVSEWNRRGKGEWSPRRYWPHTYMDIQIGNMNDTIEVKLSM